MDARDSLRDGILIVVMVISTLILVLRVWQDITIVVAATLMMLSLGGLFFSLGLKIRRLEESIISRERMMRVNLEEISSGFNRKHERIVEQLGVIVDGMNRRYR